MLCFLLEMEALIQRFHYLLEAFRLEPTQRLHLLTKVAQVLCTLMGF